MRIIESKEGRPVAKSLEMVLPVFGIEKNMPLILVNADIVIESDRRMQEIIDEIESDKERPVIFYSFDLQGRLEMRGHPASRLFYKKDVGFVKMPVELVELKKIYDILVSGKKIANPAAEALFGIKAKKNIISILLHDFSHKNLRPKVLEKAKKEFGFTGSEDQVEKSLRLAQGESAGMAENKEWKGKVFPGVFCDIEGTLLFINKIKSNVLEKLKKYSKTKPVTLWSGGDLEEIKKKLVANGIVYPLVSKYAFEGSKVEVIIDDLAQDEFEKRYKISSEKYIQEIN